MTSRTKISNYMDEAVCVCTYLGRDLGRLKLIMFCSRFDWFLSDLRITLKFLVARRVAWNKIPAEDPQISGATVQTVVTLATWHPVYVHPCCIAELETVHPIRYQNRTLDCEVTSTFLPNNLFLRDPIFLLIGVVVPQEFLHHNSLWIMYYRFCMCPERFSTLDFGTLHHNPSGRTTA
jgi:hypothetical protein